MRLRAEAVAHGYDGLDALGPLDLVVEPGERLAVIGPSGCGKSTLLSILGGLVRPSHGRVLLEDAPPPGSLVPVAFVFQDFALLPWRTVEANVALPLEDRLAPAERRERVRAALARTRLSDFARAYPRQLSGGMRQRVGIARALVVEPGVLLLDEPLSALDAKIRVALRNEIRTIQRQLGITTIYVTHDQEEALSLSDRVVVMNAGVIEQIGAPFEVYNFPKTAFVASFVGTLNIVEVRVSDPAAGALQLADVTILASPAHLSGRRAGETVKVAMRPEMIHIESTGAADENRLTGVVENVAFLGAIARIHLRVGEMTVLVDEFNNPHLAVPAVGSTLTCYFAREGCIVLA